MEAGGSACPKKAGKISFSGFYSTVVKVETADEVEEYELTHLEHVAQPLIQTVVDELLERGRCSSTGISAARTTKVMDEILAEWKAE